MSSFTRISFTEERVNLLSFNSTEAVAAVAMWASMMADNGALDRGVYRLHWWSTASVRMRFRMLAYLTAFRPDLSLVTTTAYRPMTSKSEPRHVLH